MTRLQSNLHQTFEADIQKGRGFPHQSTGMFRPSEGSAKISYPFGEMVVGGCARATWYRLKEIQVPEEEKLAHQTVRMDVGKQVEQFCIERYKRAGIFIANNVAFRTQMLGVDIAGELDAICTSEPGGGHKIIVEDKSLYGYYADKTIFGRFLKMGKDPGRPKWSHLFQLAIYLYHFSLLSKDDPAYIPMGALHYIERGDGHFGVFDVWLEREWKVLPEGSSIPIHRIAYGSKEMDVPDRTTTVAVEDILERFRMVKNLLPGNIPPPRDYIKEYSREQIEARYKADLISKSAYDKYISSHSKKGKGKERIGDWNCIPLYCKYASHCWASPNA